MGLLDSGPLRRVRWYLFAVHPSPERGERELPRSVPGSMTVRNPAAFSIIMLRLPWN